MSEVIDAAVARLTEKDTSEFDGRARFVIEDEGTIMLDKSGVRAADEAADVTLTSDAETFRAILDGELDPTSAFMTGRLSVDGDMGLAMQLGAVLN